MSIDATVIRALVHAYTPLIGAQITKIHMPSPYEIHLTLRQPSGTYALSVHPDAPYFIPLNTKCTYPIQPHAFCMVLRKHCEHGIITAIDQPDMERIVHIDINVRQPWDDVGTDVRLIVEWMGKHSNVIVVRGDTVLDACRRITPAMSRYRTLVPGAPYVPAPSTARIDPLSTDGATFAAWVQTTTQHDTVATDTVATDIVARYAGLSPTMAREIVHRARTMGWKSAWTSIMDPIKAHTYTPTITHAHKLLLTVFVPTQFDAPHTCAPSIIDALQTIAREQRSAPVRVPALHSWVRQELIKKNKKKMHLQEAIDAAHNAHTYQTCGHLIYTHMQDIKQGMTHLTIPGVRDPIPLDATRTPAQNASKYFEKYKKLRDQLHVRIEQYEACTGDIEHLEAIAHQLVEAHADDIEAIIAELKDCGYDIRHVAHTKKTAKKSTPVGYVSSTGIPIYYGRNNRQNDELTHKFANAADMWLHVRHIAGAHVIVRTPAGQRIDDVTLLEAAHVAAWHSVARMSSNVAVDVAIVQRVKKRPKGKPGQVLYEPDQTVVVTPDRTRIEQLRRL